VVVAAWEFPDVPDHAFDGEPRNDWVQGANRCALVIVGGPFTADALRRAGVRTPIRIVPVTVGPEYFQVPGWSPNRRTLLDCPAYVFPAAGRAAPDVISCRPPAAVTGRVALASRQWHASDALRRAKELAGPADGVLAGLG